MDQINDTVTLIADEWEMVEYDYLTKLYDPQASEDYPVLLDAMAAVERKTMAFRGVENGTMTFGDLASFGFKMPPTTNGVWPFIIRRITSVRTANRAFGGLNESPMIEGFTGGYTEHMINVQIDILLGVNLISAQDSPWARTNWVRLLQEVYGKNDTLGGRCNSVSIKNDEHAIGRRIPFGGMDYYGHSVKAVLWATYPITGAPTPPED